LIWIKRREIDGSVIVIFVDGNGRAFVPSGSYRKQGDGWPQARASSRKMRCGKRTLSTGCVNEFAFVPLQVNRSLSRTLSRPLEPQP